MIRDQLIVHISGFRDSLKGAGFQHLRRKCGQRLIAFEPADVPRDLLRDSGGKHAGVRTGIGGQLLLIEFLGDPQRFIRAELEQPGAVVLKLRQVV